MPLPLPEEMDCYCCVVGGMPVARPWGMRTGLLGTGMADGSGMQLLVQCPRAGISMEPFLWATGCTYQAVLLGEGGW
jgi:hypothetical protein